MGNVCINSTGSGAGSDECTAVANDVAIGVTAIVNGSDDEPVEGTLQFTGDAQPTDVFPLKTFYNNNLHQKRIGVLSVDNTNAISLTNYATGQILISYPLPVSGSNWTGKRICMKTGNYPENINDGFLVDNKIGAYIKTGLTAGTKYYFRCWDYLDTSVGRIYSDVWSEANMVAPNNSGKTSITSSKSWIVPTGVRALTVFAVGGGGGGGNQYWYAPSVGNAVRSGGGGGGGYYTVKTISVTPGESLTCTIGAGAGATGTGGTTKLLRGSTVLVSANGGKPGSNATSFNTTSSSGYLAYAEGGNGTGKGATGTAFTIREESSWNNARGTRKNVTNSSPGGNGVKYSLNETWYGGGGGASYLEYSSSYGNYALKASDNGAGNGSAGTGGGGVGSSGSGYSGSLVLSWS